MRNGAARVDDLQYVVGDRHDFIGQDFSLVSFYGLAAEMTVKTVELATITGTGGIVETSPVKTKKHRIDSSAWKRKTFAKIKKYLQVIKGR